MSLSIKIWVIQRPNFLFLLLATILRDAGLCKSTGDASRTIEQRGVRVDGKTAEQGARLGTGTHFIEVGKRRALRVTVGAVYSATEIQDSSKSL